MKLLWEKSSQFEGKILLAHTKDIIVNTGFRDSRLDIPDPPPAQSAANQQDEENMDARPDQEEMEQVVNKFLQLLEKQEMKGLKDLATLLPHCHSYLSLHKGPLPPCL